MCGLFVLLRRSRMNSDYRSIINSSFRLEVNIHMFMLPQWVIKLIVSWKIYWKIWIENNIIFYDYDHVKYNMKWLCYWKPWSDRIGQKLKRWQYDGLDHTLSLWVYLCCRLMNKKRSFYNCVRHVGFLYLYFLLQSCHLKINFECIQFCYWIQNCH